MVLIILADSCRRPTSSSKIAQKSERLRPVPNG